jgi:putative flavoprotein involved in K+ transport
MATEKVDTLVIGGGQAGLAMSEHLSKRGLSHLVLERDRIAESWRSRRWDSLVANGPAWHDRFPGLIFSEIDQDSFASKDRIVEYFEKYAEQIATPLRCGVEVRALREKPDGFGLQVETTQGLIEANSVVVATGPFQRPHVPPLVPTGEGIVQIHSSMYRNPDQLPTGAVLVVGAGSSGVQIADELLRAGRRVYLSVGPHNRPPRRYRGRDFCWWLGVLGKWDAKPVDPETEHVTIAVSGARGGHTVDFRELAARGMTLVGRAGIFGQGVMHFAPDLARNIALGDADYLSVLDEADAYVDREGLDFPAEPDARIIGPDPECVAVPVMELDLAQAGIASIVWATGYDFDFGWLKVDAFDEKGRPIHKDGVSRVAGLYFLGLPWLSRRASAFIWGVWRDAEYLASHIAENQKVI